MTKREMQKFVKDSLCGVIFTLWETELYEVHANSLYYKNGNTIPLSQEEVDYIIKYAQKICSRAAKAVRA